MIGLEREWFRGKEDFKNRERLELGLVMGASIAFKESEIADGLVEGWVERGVCFVHYFESNDSIN